MIGDSWNIPNLKKTDRKKYQTETQSERDKEEWQRELSEKAKFSYFNSILFELSHLNTA